MSEPLRSDGERSFAACEGCAGDATMLRTNPIRIGRIKGFFKEHQLQIPTGVVGYRHFKKKLSRFSMSESIKVPQSGLL